MFNFCKFIFILQLLLCSCTIYYDDDNTLDAMKHENEVDDDFNMLVSGGFHLPASLFANYVVSLRTRKATEFFGDNHYCAGIIIGSRFVLTAGQCLVGAMRVKIRPSRILVMTGVHNRLHHTSHVKEYEVEWIVFHPLFKRHGIHNLAIIKVSSYIVWVTDGMRFMPMHEESPKVNTTCTAAGWGQLLKDGPYAAMIVYLNLPILPHEKCEQVYGDRYDSSFNLCAGNLDNPQSSACVGDMGGPLICSDKLAGIISWSVDCGTTANPMIFTDISSYRDWIIQVKKNVAHRSFDLLRTFQRVATIVLLIFKAI